MANYTIMVQNKSGTVREYVLFKNEPKANSTPGNRVFQNAYINAKSVSDGTGTANFQIQTMFSAITGIEPDANNQATTNEVHESPPEGINAKTTMTEGDETASKNAIVKDAMTDHVIAQVCQNANGDTVSGSVAHLEVVEGKPRFHSREPQETCNIDGSFLISIDGSLESQNPDKVFVGFSAGDPYSNGDITSISTIPAHPNTTNVITPVSKFYVSWGTQSFSDSLQASTIGSPALVDFTGKRSEKADVVHNKSGTWTVTYN